MSKFSQCFASTLAITPANQIGKLITNQFNSFSLYILAFRDAERILCNTVNLSYSHGFTHPNRALQAKHKGRKGERQEKQQRSL
jgi:hypothetical protein